MEGFQSRLDQVFGGLANGAAPSLWSVSGTQLERRRWLPEEVSDDEQDEGPTCSSSFKSGEEQLEAKRPRKQGDGEDDEEDEIIRVEAMVGMDTTLDFEEEEDEYDKVAVGREGAGDRLYTSDVKASFDGLSVLSSLRSTSRDDRASHKAAADRLAEDDREARMNNKGGGDLRRRSSRPPTDPTTKRKNENTANHRPGKKVRFAVEDNSKEDAGDHPRHLSRAGDDRYKNVPHHVRHPEKYTHYTLDWSEDTSNNNVQAWQSTMAAINSSKSDEQQQPFELPQRVEFVPRSNKERAPSKSGGSTKTSTPVASVSFAARDEVEDESVPMDEISQPSSKGQKGRSYRSRTTTEA